MWATAQEVLDMTGVSVSSGQIRRSQYTVFAYTGLTEDSVLSDRDAYFLKLAVVFQTVYDEEVNRPDPGVTSLAQGDLTVGYDGVVRELSPKAYAALSKIRGSRVRTVPVKSLYTYDDGTWEAI